MKKYYMTVSKWSISISPRNTYMMPNCNYCTLTAFRVENGFSVELYHFIKRNDEFIKIHNHNIGHARTVADVFDVAREYVKISKVYK